MNIRNKWAFLSFILVGCVTPKKAPPKSAWADLGKSEQTECKDWPLDERDLDVRAIYPVGNQETFFGYAVETRTRDGGISHIFLRSSNGLDFELSKAQPIPIGTRGVILSTMLLGNTPIVITSKVAGNRSTLEARNLNNNQIIGISPFIIDGDLRSADVSIAGKDVWLSLRSGDYSTSFARFSLAKGKGVFERVLFSSESRGATLVASDARQAPFLVELSSLSGKPSLKLSSVNQKEFSLGSYKNLTLPTSNGVESWSVTGNGSGGLFSAVVGDSMVGQASIVVGQFDSSREWGNIKTVDLSDLHVSEPVWSNFGNIVAIMKWIDAEGTLGVYRLSDKGEVNTFDKGVFPQGSVPMSLFQVKANNYGVVVRNKKDDLWRYRVCKIRL